MHAKNFNAINFGGVMSDGTKRLSQDGQEISSFFGQSSFATYLVVHKNSIIRVDKDLGPGYFRPLAGNPDRGRGGPQPVKTGIRVQPGCVRLRHGGHERHHGGAPMPVPKYHRRQRQ